MRRSGRGTRAHADRRGLKPATFLGSRVRKRSPPLWRSREPTPADPALGGRIARSRGGEQSSSSAPGGLSPTPKTRISSRLGGAARLPPPAAGPSLCLAAPSTCRRRPPWGSNAPTPHAGSLAETPDTPCPMVFVTLGPQGSLRLPASHSPAPETVFLREGKI